MALIQLLRAEGNEERAQEIEGHLKSVNSFSAFWRKITQNEDRTDG